MHQNKELFVTCGQGLEPLLLQELISLGFAEARPGYMGVFVKLNSFSDIYRINYCSRIASRVLLPLLRFDCYDQDSLYRKALSIPWDQFLNVDQTFAIDANVSHFSLKNSLFAAQVVKDAICDQFRKKINARPSVNVQSPDIQLNLFIRDRTGVISFDTSGAPLHKRGYRQFGGDAPIQETLAAALLEMAQLKGDELLYDPCCGSGTLLIEAALKITHTPPGFLRRAWGFMHLPQHSPQEWLKVKVEADQKRVPLPKGLLMGTDYRSTIVEGCKSNLKAVGFQNEIEIVKSDFRSFEPPVPPQVVFTNPPHGKRLDDVEQLRPLYRALGEWMKKRSAKPGRGFIFTGNLELAKEVGLAAKRRHVVFNSGIESRLLEFDLF